MFNGLWYPMVSYMVVVPIVWHHFPTNDAAPPGLRPVHQSATRRAEVRRRAGRGLGVGGVGAVRLQHTAPMPRGWHENEYILLTHCSMRRWMPMSRDIIFEVYTSPKTPPLSAEARCRRSLLVRPPEAGVRRGR